MTFVMNLWDATSSHAVDATSSHAARIFLHPCGSVAIEGMESNGAVNMALGYLVWHDTNVAKEGHSVILETALRLNRNNVMPQEYPLANEVPGPTFPGLYLISTPLKHLFLASTIVIPGENRNPELPRRHRIDGRLAVCDRASKMRLEVLQLCGVDLEEYRKQTNKDWDSQKAAWVPDSIETCGMTTPAQVHTPTTAFSASG
jgi:hypothetical protein